MSGLSEKVPEDPPPDESNDDVRQNLIDLAAGWWVSSSVRPSESNEFENQHKDVYSFRLNQMCTQCELAILIRMKDRLLQFTKIFSSNEI